MNNKIEIIPQHKKSFEDRLVEYDKAAVEKLKTIKIWIFGSTSNPEDKYFFIVNNLYSSNYREKIRGRLLFDYTFLEEIDTEDKLEYDKKDNLTFNSIVKLHNKNEELKLQYKGSFV